MKIITRILFVLSICSITAFTGYGQEAIPASGGTATGTGGSATYTVGQLVFKQYNGSGGFIIQGVQQPYEISIVTAIENTEDITLECMVYPNPTSGDLKLVIKSLDYENMMYRLYNLNGSLLQGKKIEDRVTSISLNEFQTGVYFLRIIRNKQEIKVFKIIKTQ